MAPELVIVGRVVSAHGIHGRMVIEPLTENPDRFMPGSELRIEGDDGVLSKVVTIEGAAPHKKRLLVSFLEVQDRNGALNLTGRYLYVPADELPEPAPGEYYHHQLVSLEAVDISGESLGVVKDVVEMPGQDMLIIDRSGTEYMIPFVDEFIDDVDLDRGVIFIRSIPGLFGETGK